MSESKKASKPSSHPEDLQPTAPSKAVEPEQAPKPKVINTNAMDVSATKSALETALGINQSFLDFSKLQDHLNKSINEVYSRAFGFSDTYSALKQLSLTLNEKETSIDRTSDVYRRFRDEISTLRASFEHQAQQLKTVERGKEENEQQVRQLQNTLAALEAKVKMEFLLSKVSTRAHDAILTSSDLSSQFLAGEECKAFVMAVDIRRSTELMLKAREPQAFASFITNLCEDFMEIVKSHFGVFDKFTGDGILAFFPEFYSGSDAAYYAVKAAESCHASFREHYQRNRKSFSSVLTDVGLGIGLDYGNVHLVQIAGGLTVVGAPVVYACRLSGAPPNSTFANQPAYEEVVERCGSSCFVNETTIDIKHEGNMLAYDLRLNTRSFEPKLPSWADGLIV